MKAKDLIARLKDNLEAEVLIHDASTDDDLPIGTVTESYDAKTPTVLYCEGAGPA